MATTPMKVFGLHLPRPQAISPLFVALGFIAFLISGFVPLGVIPQHPPTSQPMPVLQPVPIYAYLGVLLLTLQVLLAQDKTIGRTLYTFVASALALTYAGILVFASKLPDLVKNPYLYAFLNVLLVIVFIYDAIVRRRQHILERIFTDDEGTPRGTDKPARPFGIAYLALASDAAGMAVLSGVASLSLYLLYDADARVASTLRRLRLINPAVQFFNIKIDLPAFLGGIPLWQLDFVLMLAALTLLFVLLVMIGFLIALGQFPTQFGRILREAGTQVLYSLRLVSTPFVWLIPATSIAFFSAGVASSLWSNYLQFVSGAPPDFGAILALVNPFSSGVDSYGVALGDLVLGALAVLFVILAVAFVEVDSKVIARTISLIGAVSQRLALTLVFFIAGLATFNAIPIALRPAVREPFRVGTPGLVALIATAITIAVQMVRSRQNAAK